MMSTKERAPLFSEELDTFDPKAWDKPKGTPAKEKPKPAITRKAAEAAGFRSREPAPAPVISEPAPKRDRRYRSGRDAQLHIKVKPNIQDLFLELCDRLELKQVEGFEQAVQAWQREVDARK
jgi:hypothetical protein